MTSLSIPSLQYMKVPIDRVHPGTQFGLLVAVYMVWVMLAGIDLRKLMQITNSLRALLSGGKGMSGFGLLINYLG